MIRTPRFATAVLLLVVVSGGCRYGQYGSCPPGGCGLCDGIGNARVAPPATNSYQIPATNQPYYAPTTGTNLNGLPPVAPTIYPGTIPVDPSLGSTNGAGSTYPTVQSSVQPASGYAQPGWRPTDAPNGSGFYGAPNPNSGTPAYPAGFQPNSTDYRSTPIDERMDASRLPTNDASMVRAPTNFSPTGNWQMLNPAMPPGQFEYRTTPQVAGLNANSPWSTGYPPNPSNYQLPVVLAQASTSPELLARDPNYQAGWRDRAPSGEFLNR